VKFKLPSSEVERVVSTKVEVTAKVE